MAKKAKKSSKRVKLIINPEAGETKDPTGRVEQVTRLLSDQGLKVSVAVAKPKSAAEKIARKAARKGYQSIIVMGGDGTIEGVARALVDTKVKLGILPGGTENNIVKSLGIPQDLEAACRLIVDGKTRKIDVGQIKNKQGKKVYFLELAAVGLIAALFPEGKGIAQGDLSGLGNVVSQFIRYKTPKMILDMEGSSHLEIESLLVTVANIPSFGTGFLIAPEASVEDGLLDVNLYPNISKAGIVAYFAAVSNEGKSRDTKVERYRTKKLTIRADPKQEVMADGIMLGKGKVKIRVRKQALRVIAGTEPGLAKETTAREEKLPAPVAPTPEMDEAKAQMENKEKEQPFK